LSHAPNNLYKRTANNSEFFGDYTPYAPKKAAEYRTDMDVMVDNAMHGPLDVQEKFNPKRFTPISVRKCRNIFLFLFIFNKMIFILFSGALW